MVRERRSDEHTSFGRANPCPLPDSDRPPCAIACCSPQCLQLPPRAWTYFPRFPVAQGVRRRHLTDRQGPVPSGLLAPTDDPEFRTRKRICPRKSATNGRAKINRLTHRSTHGETIQASATRWASSSTAPRFLLHQPAYCLKCTAVRPRPGRDDFSRPEGGQTLLPTPSRAPTHRQPPFVTISPIATLPSRSTPAARRRGSNSHHQMVRERPGLVRPVWSERRELLIYSSHGSGEGTAKRGGGVLDSDNAPHHAPMVPLPANAAFA